MKHRLGLYSKIGLLVLSFCLCLRKWTIFSLKKWCFSTSSLTLFAASGGCGCALDPCQGCAPGIQCPSQTKILHPPLHSGAASYTWPKIHLRWRHVSPFKANTSANWNAVSRQIWRRCHTSVDSGDLSQAPPKQSAVCSTCITPVSPTNCKFIWMASGFGMECHPTYVGVTLDCTLSYSIENNKIK